MVRSVNQAIKQLLLLASLALLSLQAVASFTASVDRNRIAQYETFELTLRTDAGTSAAPELDVLEQDFDVLGTRQNRQVRIINGKSESWRDWIVTLSPKRAGNLTIPAITLGNLTSQPIALQVSAGSTNNDVSDNASPVFIRAEVNSESVFVQQEVVLTLQIFHRVELFGERSLTPLNIDSALIQQLAETRSYDTVANGVRFGVMELKFSIHPQQAGLMEIPSLAFSGTIGDRRSSFGSFFSMGSGKPVVARSPEIVISVKPQPENYSGNIWLPAKNLTLTDGWSSSTDDIKVGDAITRTIVIKAEGLSSNQLPSVAMPKPDGINTYPDQSTSDDKASETGVVGSRIEAMALIPTRAGKITLPAIRYRWFDTQTNSEQVAEIAAKTLIIKPSDTVEPLVASLPEKQTAITPTVSESCPEPMLSDSGNSDNTRYWQIISALLAAGWLLTLIGFGLKLRRKETSKPTVSTEGQQSATERVAFSQFKSACQNSDYSLARQKFIVWYQAANGGHFSSVQQCLRSIGDNELSQCFQQAETSSYSASKQSIDCKPLLKAVTKIRTSLSGQQQKQKSNLPPLYPMK